MVIIKELSWIVSLEETVFQEDEGLRVCPEVAIWKS